MSDIRHQIRIRQPRAKVFAALSTIDGLSRWWTRTTTGSCDLNGEIDFRFGDHVSAMKVVACDLDERVSWRCTRSAPDWIDTLISFELSDDGDRTVVSFVHGEWREANSFFAHCSTKWAVFLLSLKQYLETGEGAPFPDDTPI